MSSNNFKPMFWSKYCQTELAKDLVLANWCDYQYEGEIKQGAKLKIVGAVRPTIQKYVPGQDLNIEHLGNNSQYLEITEADAFCFDVDDVDRAQEIPGYLETQFNESKKALAESADKFVGTQAKNALASMKSASTDISGLTDPLTPIDSAHVALYKNDVSSKDMLAADLNAEHIVAIRHKLQQLFTNNIDIIKNGAVGQYGNTYLRMSNDLYNDGTDDFEMIRTKKAIAFAGQIDKVETARKEAGFCDIIKGLHVYGSKLVRPKELYVVRAH